MKKILITLIIFMNVGVAEAAQEDYLHPKGLFKNLETGEEVLI